jgi:ketosteroid isomerase-like protein
MGVFARIGGDWDGFAAVSDELIDGGDTIVSLGNYSGTFKGTGKPMRAQFVHVFRVKNGKITGFQQYADTLGTAIAMGR